MKNSHKLGDVFYQYELDNHKNDILKFNDSSVNNFNKNNSLAVFIHIKDSNSVYGGIIHNDKSVLFCKEKNKKTLQIKSKGKIIKGFIKAFSNNSNPDTDILFKFNEAFAVAKTKGSDELHLHFEKSSDCYEGYSNFIILEDQNTIQRITAYNLDFFIYPFIYYQRIKNNPRSIQIQHKDHTHNKRKNSYYSIYPRLVGNENRYYCHSFTLF
ncbi:hypothetical protein CL6EHI_154320 [Entamoeba histolytica]|uniref:Uncharacterized protein n=2 Tax=Entamoeba histolytica TaxID=5759 RepID=C4M595_ENTH1|nr:hypothetical protein EHI_154320 [Entamoeba histolytica HM-1:IMSS]EAL45058.1 hypothetical protein EHI_154320 [Entamoeba histolytica HM-1:IMSS]GAT96587.1 hypothetical protein CL6EHI_154320 [Entamoeba histolytica]|eukprot:XP_650447.1 hypothetical protein EHI_154320 [Entamoeba histolytica HM-1:IMSS]